tara:strand:- start:258 stop:566 length:309 start_codon:yes stop_codon:yes gene_type:complete
MDNDEKFLQNVLEKHYRSATLATTPSKVLKQVCGNKVKGLCKVSTKEYCKFDKTISKLSTPEEIEPLENVKAKLSELHNKVCACDPPLDQTSCNKPSLCSIL